MSEWPRRRQFLQTAATVAAVGVAGCSDSVPVLNTDSESPTAGARAAEPDQTSEATPGDDSTESGGESAEVNISRTQLENYLRIEVNDFRTAHDASRLAWEPTYRKPARTHSAAMAATGQLNRSVRGESASDRVWKAAQCEAGIAIARLDHARDVQTAADRLVQQWVQDSTTRETLLSNLYQDMGVGAATGGGDMYVTLVLC